MTLPSTEGANLGVVDELSALGLQAIRRDYQLSRKAEHTAFSRFVLTEVMLKGYATHGADGRPLTARR